jgi:hypothetical protein
LAVWLVVLVGVGVAGWVLGTQVLANEPQRPPPVVVEAPAVAPPRANESGVGAGVIVPRGGLSPFGHADGLRGRQVLVGRVVAADASTITLDWAGGRTLLRFTEDSDLLMRLAVAPGQPIEPGSAIALLVSEEDGEIIARSGVLLPESSRPVNDAQRFPDRLFPEPAPDPGSS